MPNSVIARVSSKVVFILDTWQDHSLGGPRAEYQLTASPWETSKDRQTKTNILDIRICPTQGFMWIWGIVWGRKQCCSQSINITKPQHFHSLILPFSGTYSIQPQRSRREVVYVCLPISLFPGRPVHTSWLPMVPVVCPEALRRPGEAKACRAQPRGLSPLTGILP